MCLLNCFEAEVVQLRYDFVAQIFEVLHASKQANHMRAPLLAVHQLSDQLFLHYSVFDLDKLVHAAVQGSIDNDELLQCILALVTSLAPLDHLNEIESLRIAELKVSLAFEADWRVLDLQQVYATAHLYAVAKQERDCNTRRS